MSEEPPRRFPFVTIKVVDKVGDILPVNTPGELCVRGYNVFKGYYEDMERTKEAIDSDNWYHTGDICTMDEEGYVSVISRLKDMIIRGGENIYPVEIEDFFLKHPSVDDVHVVGVPDDRMGEEVCACFRIKKDHQVTEEELKEYCKGKVSSLFA
ncbi:hypothetical protein LAZ67_3000777 [Cordylochernes scorpioides]|uniref:Medium-chain acyl-CoA ligase ACSF2, mitochondrial n=1 Tax=Cordylochernes scorpioides TaxID=51811 RepID=A0ABY6KB40_9ARAC|nr:hypothetical protein LAZ67_3000777 [Cordylochernes scorpioides]